MTGAEVNYNGIGPLNDPLLTSLTENVSEECCVVFGRLHSACILHVKTRIVVSFCSSRTLDSVLTRQYRCQVKDA